MNAPLPVLLIALLLSGPHVHGTPETLKLIDGTLLENVTSAVMEDGKIKVVHSGGTSRKPVADFSPEALKSLGIHKEHEASHEVLDLKRIETTDGKVYEDVRSVKIKPSFISFVHKEGAASVRFEKLPEEIQTKCGYSEEVARQFDEERAAAEKAMQEEEARLARIARSEAERKEMNQRRESAFYELQMMGIGTTSYWLSDPRLRGLRDAVQMQALQEAGYSPQEAMNLLNWAKFR